jgi:4'-phosphopantetheinyl transferase
MRFPKRRVDWRLGRWAAKNALAAYLRLPADLDSLSKIEIRTAASGAPEVVLETGESGVAISLSHRAGTAACAVANRGAMLGCDLEIVEPRSEAFVADYFTTVEQGQILHAPAGERERVVALMWSGKESALKALRAGLRLDTRCVEVMLLRGEGCAAAADWQPMRVRYGAGEFCGWWQYAEPFCRTIIAAPPSPPPVELRPAYSFSLYSSSQAI